MKKRNNAGFTLVELVVGIAISTIVTAAAASVLLLGMQVRRQSFDTSNQLMTVRTLLSVMEDAAAEGKINKIVLADDSSWQLGEAVTGEENTISPIFSYNAQTQEIITNGATVLEGVYASNAVMEGQLLSLSIETKDGIYETSIYCRAAVPATNQTDSTDTPGPGATDANVMKFLEILKSQYRSRGQVQASSALTDTTTVGKYYSEWYIGANYNDTVPDNGWDADTPWCACYISWALVQAGKTGGNNDRWYANVDDFMEYFQNKKNQNTGKVEWRDRQTTNKDTGATDTTIPTAGDLIFFDWDKGTDPEHVGVVLSVSEKNGTTVIYTIEGNSAGRVTIRTYSANDARIIGYGRLAWSS